MTRLSAYDGYVVIGLAIDVRDKLDPEIFDRLVHGGLRGISQVEARDIADQLEELRDNAA